MRTFLITLALLASGLRATAVGPIHGSVLFPADTLLATQSNVFSVAVADLDLDGHADVITSSNNPEKIAWYRSNGDGTFGSTQYVITTSPSSAAIGNVATGDLDGDGRIDVVYWTGDQRIKWSRNIGGALSTGLFGYNAGNQTANQTPISTTPNIGTTVAVADVNGDTYPDVLSITGIFNTEPGANTGGWCQNFGGADFGFNPLAPTDKRKSYLVDAPPGTSLGGVGTSPNSILGQDVDGDGLCDLVITSRNDNTLAWFKGKVVLGATLFDRYVLSTGEIRVVSASLGDPDGDGWPDILCASAGDTFISQPGTVRWYRNTSHDTVPTTTPFHFAVGQIVGSGLTGAYSAVSGDLNSDGRKDVLVVVALLNRVFWFENLGSGNFGYNSGTPTSNQKLISTVVNFPVGLAVADFNQNGVLDAVSVSNGNGRVAAYINKGGQCALAGLDTAPASLMEGKRDDLLRVAVSNRGVAGDNSAQVETLGLLFEKSGGVMTTAEANAVIDSLHLYVDSNSSGVFELGTDALVASVAELSLVSGRQVFTVAPGTPAHAQVAPAATRNFFVVPKIAALAAGQPANSFRVTHLSTGTGRSTFKDAVTATALTLESLVLTNTTSAYVTALPAHTYDDHTYIYFDSNSAPGTGPLDDFDYDSVANLSEFGFGSDPTVSLSAAMVVTGGVLVQRGQPTVLVTNTQTGVNFQALFCRRKDPLAALTYTVEFSATLLTWVASTATPTILADDGVIEAVAVPYPFFVNGKKARFFRVVVSSP